MNITIHHYHHFDLHASREEVLYDLLAKILNQGKSIMDTVATLNEKLDALTKAQVDERAEHLAQLQALRDSLPAGAATQEQIDELGARLDQAITQAKGIVDAADTTA